MALHGVKSLADDTSASQIFSRAIEADVGMGHRQSNVKQMLEISKTETRKN